MGTIKIHPMENLISIKLHPEKIHQDSSSARIPPDSIHKPMGFIRVHPRKNESMQKNKRN
jgi:hypothetical protein